MKLFIVECWIFQHSALNMVKNQDKATDEPVVEQNNIDIICFLKKSTTQ